MPPLCHARRTGPLLLLAAALLSGAQLEVTVGKSVVLDSPAPVQRVSVANGDLAEAVAITSREILINGKAPGESTVILWEAGGRRVIYDLHVRVPHQRLEDARDQLRTEFPGQDLSLELRNDAVFLRGTAADLMSADRAVAIAATLGKVINLLRVKVPPAEPQILLQVRFANVDRAASMELGINLTSTGAAQTLGGISTGQFSPPRVDADRAITLTDALNIFLMRPDLNLLATIRALEGRRLLEILAEPNVLAVNGRPASFLAGGEFPFPTLQGGGAGLGAVTVQFREFGVRISFLPLVTPRGTIRLRVTPEVSSLDMANSLTVQGFSIPALSTRRVETEIELASGQSFGIAGLLDNRTIEVFNQIPGLAQIPLLGKLFQSRSQTRNHSELLIMVTPEVVRPIPAGPPWPVLAMPLPFLPGLPVIVPRALREGSAPPARESVPYEELVELRRAGASPSVGTPAAAPPPMLTAPAPSGPPGGGR